MQVSRFDLGSLISKEATHELFILVTLSFFFRQILAICHFNENLRRETVQTKQGNEYLHVVYPKFKLGEEIV